MMNKRRTKKGSALITTVMVVLLVCALIGTMLSLSLWAKTLSKGREKSLTRQNQLDMLTDMFLKYGIEPSDTFGYFIEVFYYEDGTSTMTVRAKEDSVLCDMVVEQLNGELISRYYDIPYEHAENEAIRTIGIHNEKDTNPHLKLTVPKSMVSANGPFYVYGKIKLERAVGIDSSKVRAYVNMSMNGGAQKTVMTLSSNTDGWVNLHNADGTPLKFDSVPSSSLDFLIGLDKTSGDLILSNLVIVNSKGNVCYSLANDPHLNGVGDLRTTSLSKWTRHSNPTYTTTYPVVTQDPDNYVPQRVLSVTQSNYRCHGEPFLALYKSALRDIAGAGFYYITGRFRTSNITRAELCDAAGDSPTAMFLDVHDYYNHDNNESTPDIISSYPAGVTTSDGAYFASSGCWTPLLDQHGNYLIFYVPENCERTGEDYIKFTLWAAQGSFDLADIRVYKLDQNATPDPANETPVYNMELDTSLVNQAYGGCPLGEETRINDIWSIHWLSYAENPNYADKLDYTQEPGNFNVYSIVNPKTVFHNKGADYDLFQFSNEIVGQPYKDPNS